MTTKEKMQKIFECKVDIMEAIRERSGEYPDKFESYAEAVKNLPNDENDMTVSLIQRDAEELYIPEGIGITKIGDYAFNNYANIYSVDVPDGVITIGKYAFCQCGMMNMSIGKDVTSIGDYAIYGCSTLSTLMMNATTPPTIKYSTLDGCKNLSHIYVPTASVDAYKAATIWSNYADIISKYPWE